MHASLIFLICAPFISYVICDCEYSYVDCFSAILRNFFGRPKYDATNNVSETNTINKTIAYEVSESDKLDFDKVLSDIESVLIDLDSNIRKSELIIKRDNKTEILVKTFDRDDDLENADTTEKEILSSATAIDAKEDVSFSDFNPTTQMDETTTDKSLQVIPLQTKSEQDNEIFNYEKQSYNDVDEQKFVSEYPDIDYIEIYRDTTNEQVTYETTENNIVVKFHDLRAEINKQEEAIEDLIKHSSYIANEEALAEVVMNVTEHTDKPDGTIIKSLAPWIATIFLKNETADQFDYYCDGALLSDKVVLTAARCVNNGNGSFPAENFIVILGKTSLQISGGNEKVLRVQQVKYHQNFTIEGSVAKNDLALLILEEPVSFNKGISVASLKVNDESLEDAENTIAMTTAWRISGDIALIYFDKEKSRACESNNKVENTFCATYGDDVALCPSYGGLYVTKQGDQLCLTGIRTGDPTDRGICFNKNVNYTSLANHTQWITDNIEI